MRQSKEADALKIKKGLFVLIIVGSLLLGDLGNFDATGGFSAADMQTLSASVGDQAPINNSDIYTDAYNDSSNDNNGSDGNDAPR